MNDSRFSREAPEPSGDPGTKLANWVTSTDDELVDELRQGVGPAKTYRVRMPDKATWLQMSGAALLGHAQVAVAKRFKSDSIDSLVITDAMRALFDMMRANDFVPTGQAELSGIQQLIQNLEYPCREGFEPYWEDNADVVRL